MVNLRLRTKFLISLLLVSAAVTVATLLMVGRSVRIQVRKEIAENLANSVTVFRDFQRQREINLASSAELLANLPSLRALMTTRDAATIQDASTDIWRLAPSDLFVLADPAGAVLAIHTSRDGMTRAAAERLLKNSAAEEQPTSWWFDAGRLYQVFLRPIYFGSAKDGTVFGILGVGHEISSLLASDLSHVASSEVAFFYGSQLIASTLTPDLQNELSRAVAADADTGSEQAADLQLGHETFLATTVPLTTAVSPHVRLSVLKSYDKAAVFLTDLNGRLILLGIIAIVTGSAVVFVVSHTFTKPVANLLAGVHALEAGDFTYPLAKREGDEVAELTAAFDRMRATLQKTQQDLITSERLAMLGRTASYISHDLRHPLTAIVGNAEFLCDEKLDSDERRELYGEIRIAVDQMTALADSLLDISGARDSLELELAPVMETVERAVRAVKAHPQFQNVAISLASHGGCELPFDRRKVERALVNVLRNACEFVPLGAGRVSVDVRQSAKAVEIRVTDNGPGVAPEIRGKLFEPFVSHGKQNGIGLGLAIVRKVCREHGGDAALEGAEPGGTTFKLTLPTGGDTCTS